MAATTTESQTMPVVSDPEFSLWLSFTVRLETGVLESSEITRDFGQAIAEVLGNFLPAAKCS